MLEAIGMSVLFVLGFIAFGTVLGLLVSFLLVKLVFFANKAVWSAQGNEATWLVCKVSALTCAIVSGAIGIMAMIHDGPAAVLFQ